MQMSRDKSAGRGCVTNGKVRHGSVAKPVTLVDEREVAPKGLCKCISLVPLCKHVELSCLTCQTWHGAERPGWASRNSGLPARPPQRLLPSGP